MARLVAHPVRVQPRNHIMVAACFNLKLQHIQLEHEHRSHVIKLSVNHKCTFNFLSSNKETFFLISIYPADLIGLSFLYISLPNLIKHVFLATSNSFCSIKEFNYNFVMTMKLYQSLFI